ncbi:hypothetical protein NLI96_g10810 [Meripilus lineatus]|uniref:C2H2-type domain-containing protein n=1 Tax=Meripilus lineatus TaxID=2056292 RepID=A0AAD5UY06_9APHY|nr:hypothetical protein NLI96_g10810 [Physisporinus lineatus]
MSLFPCILSCNRSFQTEHGLYIHQDTCAKYSDEDTQLLELLRLHTERITAEAAEQPSQHYTALEPFPDSKPLALSSDVEVDLLNSTDVLMDDIPSPSMDIPSGRGMRNKQPTWKILEQLPVSPIPVSEAPLPETPNILSNSSTSTTIQHPLITKVVETTANIFGVIRAYVTFLTYDPDSTTSLEHLSDLPVNPHLSPPITAPHSLSTHIPSDPYPLPNRQSTTERSKPSEASQSHPNTYAPFSNWSIAGLMDWMWTGSHQKSIAELDQLVHNVLLDPRFDPSHLENFSTSRKTAKLDQDLAFKDDAWIECDVQVQVPDGHSHSQPTDPLIPIFTVPGLQR